MKLRNGLCAVVLLGCSQASAPDETPPGAAENDAQADAPSAKTPPGPTAPGSLNVQANDSGEAPETGATQGGGSSGGGSSGGGSTSTPAGWLYTQGAKIYVANGSGGGTPWMGRGVNMDDIFLCGYNDSLWMTNAEPTLASIASGLMTTWKPNFVRISLGMASYAQTTSWLTNTAQYATPMTQVINAIGAYPNTYVLVTLRSDTSMIDQDGAAGDAEATGLPSSATDATYVALVDAFASSSFVLFGVSNEPGGNTLSDATLSAAMDHAVSVIRTEENKLGVPHHIVSVQGNDWTSDISFYSTTPLTEDNVVYEIHGYPPSAASYTYSNIPVIIGEYGTLTDPATFYADLESKQIPNVAWDFEPFSACNPDLLTINQSSTSLIPTAWGTTVESYIASP